MRDSGARHKVLDGVSPRRKSRSSTYFLDQSFSHQGGGFGFSSASEFTRVVPVPTLWQSWGVAGVPRAAGLNGFHRRPEADFSSTTSSHLIFFLQNLHLLN